MSEDIVTTDLAHATFLSLNGFRPQMERRDGTNTVLFRFSSADELQRLKSLDREYRLGEARVEPQRFMKEAGKVRGVMYEILDGS